MSNETQPTRTPWARLALYLLFPAILCVVVVLARRQKQAQQADDARQAAVRQEQQTQEAARAAAKRAEEAQANAVSEAAAKLKQAQKQKADYLARYLRSTNSLKSPGLLSVAVAVARPNRQPDEALGSDIAATFAPKEVKTGQPFTPAFSEDGVLQHVLRSDSVETANLGLPSLADYLLLGSYRVEFSTNPQRENTVLAKLHFEGGVIHSADGVLLESLSFEASGLDFTNDRAEAAAKKQLVKLLTTNKWKFLEQR